LQSLLKEIDDNIDELMKEKAEYHKSGMKSTKGGFFAGGQFDVRSQASGVSRRTEDSNAYYYVQADQ
jgi:hypothetical protein